MKKAFLLLAVLFVAITAKAQFDICIGPKVGYQTTKLSTNREIIKSDFKGNMTFGVFGRVTIMKVILQPELLYYKSGKMFEVNVMGDNWGLNNPIPNPTLSISQSNLAMPIYLGYQFISTPLVKMRANIGPVFYFALGQAQYSVNGEDVPIQFNDDVTEEMTIGGAFNVGVDLWRFTLDVSYSLGLDDVIDDEIKLPLYGEVELGDDTRQNVFTVTLGFKLL